MEYNPIVTGTVFKIELMGETNHTICMHGRRQRVTGGPWPSPLDFHMWYW